MLSEERFKISLKTSSEKKTFPWHDLMFKITIDHRKDDKSLSPFSSFLFFSSVSSIHALSILVSIRFFLRILLPLWLMNFLNTLNSSFSQIGCKTSYPENHKKLSNISWWPWSFFALLYQRGQGLGNEFANNLRYVSYVM